MEYRYLKESDIQEKELPQFTFWYNVNTYLNDDGSFNSLVLDLALKKALEQQKRMIEDGRI